MIHSLCQDNFFGITLAHDEIGHVRHSFDNKTHSYFYESRTIANRLASTSRRVRQKKILHVLRPPVTLTLFFTLKGLNGKREHILTIHEQ